MTIAGRRVFDLADGWGGVPPSGIDHVVVTHRPPREGWDPDATFHFVDEVAVVVRGEPGAPPAPPRAPVSAETRTAAIAGGGLRYRGARI